MGAHIVAAASAETTEFVFLVRNAKDVPIRDAMVHFGPEGYLNGSAKVRDDVFFRAPKDARVQWRVTSPFHQPVTGDERDLRAPADMVAGVEVTMRTGWGATLFLVGNDPGRRMNGKRVREVAAGWDALPIPGAKVYADNTFVGRTDRDGRIAISERKAPREIIVRAEGWQAIHIAPVQREGGWSDAHVVSFVRVD